MSKPSKRSRPTRWPDPEAGPWQITTIWQKVDGRGECVGLEIAPCPEHETPALTASQLRTLKFGEIVEAHRVANRDELVDLRAQAMSVIEDFPAELLSILDRQIEGQSRPPVTQGRGRPVSLGVDHYQEVAQVYRAAVSSHAPVLAVADHYKTSPGTAARWVGKARKLGFLPPTTRGKARGED